MFRIVLVCIAFASAHSQATFGLATFPSGPSELDLPYGVYANETTSPGHGVNNTLQTNETTAVVPVNETTRLVPTTTTESYHNAASTTTPTNIMKITTSSMSAQNVTAQMGNTTTGPTSPAPSSAVTSLSFGCLVYLSLLTIATFR